MFRLVRVAIGSVLHARRKFLLVPYALLPRPGQPLELALGEPEPVLELGDAELQLVVAPRARRRPSWSKSDCRLAPARSVSRVASPRQRTIASSIAWRTSSRRMSPRSARSRASSSARSARQRDRADTGEREALDQLANGGLVVAGCRRPSARAAMRARAAPLAPALALAPASARSRRRRAAQRPLARRRARARLVPASSGTRRPRPRRRGSRSAAAAGAADPSADALLDHVDADPPPELGLALLEDRQERRSDEDRRVGAGEDADEQREREVLERGAAEDAAASRSAAA